jgi:acetyl esterase/lipase
VSSAPTSTKRRVRGFLSVTAIVAVTIALGGAAAVAAGWIYFHPKFEWTRGIVYGERHGTALTLDVVSPAKPNGLGVVFVVSGGWKSGTGSFQPWLAAPLLRHGYTVFPIYHLSQPEASVSEIFEDISRGVRFVRTHARDYGIDPAKIGITGGSAGGHLSLMLATRGGPGPADADDPVSRASSEVQSVAIFYPVTDLTDLTGSTEYAGEGQPPKSFLKAFRQDPVDLPSWQTTSLELSPIKHLTADLPPTLIYHGNADTLVPFSQSKRFIDEAQTLGCTATLKEVPNAGHGWLSMPLDIMAFAGWFDRTLKP